MKKYLTERNGFAGPIIEACDFDYAIQQATPLGLRVSGEWKLTIESDSMTEGKADKIAQALANSLDFDE